MEGSLNEYVGRDTSEDSFVIFQTLSIFQQLTLPLLDIDAPLRRSVHINMDSWI
jgi:hypothetical protein